MFVKMNVNGQGRDGIRHTDGAVAEIFGAAGAGIFHLEADLLDRNATGLRGAILCVISHDYQ